MTCAEEWRTKSRAIPGCVDFLKTDIDVVYANDYDGFDKNYYMYHDPNEKVGFRVISWDSDATWGNTWTGAPTAPTTRLWGN